MKIEKKIWPEYFGMVKSGTKNFELRLADFRCKPGDVLVLREWNPRSREYTGRRIEKRVREVFRTKGQRFYTKKDVDRYGFQVIGFR
jgi:ASC-1-like (ASCH) protein